MVRALLAMLVTATAAFAAGSSRVELEIERRIEAMSPDARVAQLLCIGFDGTRVNDELRRWVRDRGAGGVVIYARNINTAAQLTELTRDIRELAAGKVEPFIAVDQEGGEVTRIHEGVPLLPGAMAIGATGSPELARRAGRALGADLRRLGLKLNLAPVADVNVASPSAIDIRGFGSDPALVAAMTAAFIHGQSEAGVASTAKHFPGLGASVVDPHDALPVLDLGLEELRKTHFPPFRAAIEQQVAAVMLAHVMLPRVDAVNPASTSPAVVRLLREELHFDGVILTDVLGMRALPRHPGSGTLALRAISAGADLVIALEDRDEVLHALRRAYRSGELSDTRVRASLRRILRMKLGQAAPAAEAPDRMVAHEIAARSVTVLRNRGRLLPLRDSGARIGYIGPGGAIPSAMRVSRTLQLPVRYPGDASKRWEERARAHVRGVDVVVAAARNRAQMRVIAAARAANPSARWILISLGSPTLIDQLPDADAYVCAYGYLDPSLAAVAAVLTGLAEPRGRLPIPMPGGLEP